MNEGEMIEMVRVADSTRTERTRNDTRLYNIVNPIRGGEAEVWMWAVKDTPKGEKVCKPIQRTRTDKNYTMVSGRFMRQFTYNKFVCNWSDQPWGRRHACVWTNVDGGDLDEMSRVAIRFGRHFGQIAGVRFLNDWSGTRYESVQRWLNEDAILAYKNSNEARWLDIIMCIQMDSRVEFLLKAGLRHLVCPKLVRMLRKQEFFAWFRNNAKELKSHTVDELLIAHRRGVSLCDASTIVETARAWAGYGMARYGITTMEADKYCKKRKITPSAYASYISNCEYLNYDLTREHIRKPTHFSQAQDEAQEMADEVRRQRERADEAVRKARELAEQRARLKRTLVEEDYKRRRADALCDGIPAVVDGWEVHFLFAKWQRVQESDRMHNCIRGYKDNARIFALEKDGVRVDVEVDIRGDVIQCRLDCNKNAPADIHAVAGKVGKMMVTIERTVA